MRRPSSRVADEQEQSRVALHRFAVKIENTDSDYDREKLQERLAKLAGGVAVIKAGAATEVELKEPSTALRARSPQREGGRR